MLKSQTGALLREIRLKSSIPEKVECMHNVYQGQTAFILSCGPSTKELADSIDMHELFKDKLLLSVKQASMLAPCDFLLYNHVRNDVCVRLDDDTILVGSTDATRNKWHTQLLSVCPDVWFGINGDQPQLVQSWDWESADFNNADPFLRPWGPGIVLDVGVWLALHLGCARIVIIGWDMTDEYVHFYEDESNIEGDEAGKIEQETQDTRNAMDKFWKWFLFKRDIEIVQYAPCGTLFLPAVTKEDLWTL